MWRYYVPCKLLVITSINGKGSNYMVDALFIENNELKWVEDNKLKWVENNKLK